MVTICRVLHDKKLPVFFVDDNLCHVLYCTGSSWTSWIHRYTWKTWNPRKCKLTDSLSHTHTHTHTHYTHTHRESLETMVSRETLVSQVNLAKVVKMDLVDFEETVVHLEILGTLDLLGSLEIL